MHLVSTDTAGVPKGGPYGNVAWFEEEAKNHGLGLAWSRIWNCFALYTQPGPCRIVGQDLCMRKDNGKPIPLCRDYLNLILWLWDHAEKQTHETVAASLNRMRAKKKACEDEERRVFAEDIEAEAIRGFMRRSGRVSAPAFFYLGDTNYGRLDH